MLDNDALAELDKFGTPEGLARLAELEDATAAADTASEVTELAWRELEQAEAAVALACSARDRANTAWAGACDESNRLEGRRLVMSRELGLVRTASGYRTPAQVRAALTQHDAYADPAPSPTVAKAASDGRAAAELRLRYHLHGPGQFSCDDTCTGLPQPDRGAHRRPE